MAVVVVGTHGNVKSFSLMGRYCLRGQFSYSKGLLALERWPEALMT